jgi:TonB family protein
MNVFHEMFGCLTAKRTGIFVGCLAFGLSPAISNGQGGSAAQISGGGSEWGKTIDGRIAHGGMKEAIKAVAPEYPHSERIRYHQGSGIFHLTLDPKTGLVTEVTVKKSTGFKVLDQCAIDSFRQWRWKSGKWKEFEFPITFNMASGPPPLTPGAARLPPSERH